MPPVNLPLDVLPLILEQIDDRRDLHASALVNWAFNHAATPLLYTTLDSRIISKVSLFHPATTLLHRPELAQYVRHVTESGAVHGSMQQYNPNITNDALKALRLCTKVESLTWIDDSFTGEALILSFLEIIRNLPVKNLTIRTYSDLGEEAWSLLKTIKGLRKVAIWCMEGPPRVLQGWSESLSSTLTHLELGRCAGVPATILISVLSQVPLLRELRLKGAPSAAIPTILTYLPNLITLDTEYLGTGLYRQSNRPLPLLRNITVRTSSMDTMGPQRLWLWVRQLVPAPSLECLVLNAFSAQGQTTIPRSFILELADVHGESLREFRVGMTQLTLEDIQCLAARFPLLEDLVCCIASPNADDIGRATVNARNLRTLKLQLEWTPASTHFTEKDALKLMQREGSQLRLIGVGSNLYKGQWFQDEMEDGSRGLAFKVLRGVAEDRWV